ncbi:hypothetical protein ACTFIZ_000203 [Dictyostelium cf. discoideum]
MPNPIPISIPEGPKSDCITKEVQDLLADDAIEQVVPNRYSKRVFYSNVFTVPKPGTNLHRPVLDLKRLNTYINNQSFKMEGIMNLPSMVKQGYYMVKLDIKKAYLHVLVDPQYRDLFRFVWQGAHYRWKTMPFGLSTAPRIFTMLLRPVLRMLRDINVSVIPYLDDLLIVGSTKEECLSNLKNTIELLVKLGFKLNLEKSVLEPTQSITFLGLQIDSLLMKLLVPKEEKGEVPHFENNKVRFSLLCLDYDKPLNPPSQNSIPKQNQHPSPPSNQPITTQNTEVENQRMKNEAHKILNKFKDIFVEQIPKFQPPSRQGFDMEVKVAEGSSPIKRSYNKMSKEESNKIEAEIKRLFEIGVIEESISSYSAPLFISMSKGKERVVFDYRGVNKQTEEFAFPMPNGEEYI